MEQIQETDLNKDFVGMANCFICGEVKHLIIDKRLKKSLPKSACYDKEPCDKCKEIMKQGIFFIGVRDGEQEKENPYRTGQIIGIKDEAVKNIIKDQKLLNQVLKKRICFVELSVLKQIGLVGKEGVLKCKKNFKA